MRTINAVQKMRAGARRESASVGGLKKALRRASIQFDSSLRSRRESLNRTRRVVFRASACEDGGVDALRTRRALLICWVVTGSILVAGIACDRVIAHRAYQNAPRGAIVDYAVPLI